MNTELFKDIETEFMPVFNSDGDEVNGVKFKMELVTKENIGLFIDGYLRGDIEFHAAELSGLFGFALNNDLNSPLEHNDKKTVFQSFTDAIKNSIEGLYVHVSDNHSSNWGWCYQGSGFYDADYGLICTDKELNDGIDHFNEEFFIVAIDVKNPIWEN